MFEGLVKKVIVEVFVIDIFEFGLSEVGSFVEACENI